MGRRTMDKAEKQYIVRQSLQRLPRGQQQRRPHNNLPNHFIKQHNQSIEPPISPIPPEQDNLDNLIVQGREHLGPVFWWS